MFYTALIRLSLGLKDRHNKNKRTHIYFRHRGHPCAPPPLPPPTPAPPPVTPAARAASTLNGMRSFLIDSYSVSTRVSSIFKFVSRSGGAVGSDTVCGRRPTSKLNQLQHALKLLSLVASVSPVKRLSAGYALPSLG